MTLNEAGENAIPAMINALDGLDVGGDDPDFTKAANLVLAIQDHSGALIRIPFRTDAAESVANAEHNRLCIESLLRYWSRFYGEGAAERVALFRERIVIRRSRFEDEDDR